MSTPRAYSDRESWLEARRTGIGASDAAAVLGVSPWRGPLAVYADKTGLCPSSVNETEYMEWGARLEPVIAATYQEKTGRQLVDPGRFTIHHSAITPFAIATLDREIVGDARGPGVLEIKTGNAFKVDDWAHNDAPLIYLVQVQHQLAVTGYAWGSLAVLLGGQRFRWLDVERNDAFIAQLLQREADFWGRVQRRDPPPPDGLASTAEVLAELYPRDDGHTVALPADLQHWDDVLCEAKETIKAAETRKAEAENHLKAALGAATKGVLGPGVAYTLKTQVRKSYTVNETTFRVLRRVEL